MADKKINYTRNNTIYLVVDSFPSQDAIELAKESLKVDGYLAIRTCKDKNHKRLSKQSNLRVAGYSSTFKYDINFANL